jgi:flagellar export protein FliJ
MGFRFSLASVLLVRANAKKREELALQTIQLEIARFSRQIKDLDADAASINNAQELAMRHPIPAAHLHSFRHRLESILEARKALLQRIQTMEVERGRQMKVYQEAYRDHETIIGMFNDHRDAYEQERDRSEQKTLDDIFAARIQRS